ncbi:MAG: hypothetical protein MJZ33_00715 [Paludibacteraceae bacterium]|nr:hypothetical protein [Paludibacteraceae bacterium]
MVRVKIKWTMADNQVVDSRELDLTDNGLLTIQRAGESEMNSIVCGLLGLDAKKVSGVELEFMNYEDYE